MAYPDDLSNLPANRTDWTGAPADAPSTARVTAAAANAVETAINQIEDTLGLTPQGAAASVAARLAALDSTVAGKLATSGTAADAAAVGGVTVTGTPAAGQVLKATSTTAATWQADATGGGGGAVTSVVGATGDVAGSQIVADAAVAAALAAKANTVHVHSAADVTSGTLPLARGGTGGTDAAGARTSLGLGTAATQPATAFAPAAAVTAALDAPSTTTTGTLVAGQMALVDATSAAIARTLPAANSVPAGTVTGVKKIDGSANTVTVNRAGADTITGTAVGQTSRVLTLAGESIELTSDGTSVWVITSTDTPSPSLIATYARVGTMRPRNNFLAALGDSITSYNTGGAMSGGYHDWSVNQGWFNHLVVRSMGRIRSGGIYAGGGYTMEHIESLLLPILLGQTVMPGQPLPGACVISGGANNLSAGGGASWDFAATKATHDRIIAALQAKDILPVLWLCTPNSTNSTIRGNVEKWNTYVAWKAALYGFPLIDANGPVVNQATGDYLSGYNLDAVHPNNGGHAAIGERAITNGILNVFPDTAVQHPAWYQSTLQLQTNGYFVGDSNADGAANNWSPAGTRTGHTDSLVAPAAADLISGNWQRTSKTTSASSGWLFSGLSANPVQGDVMEMSVRLRSTGFNGQTSAGFGVYCKHAGGQAFGLTGWSQDVADGLWVGRWVVPANPGTTFVYFDVGSVTSAGPVVAQVANITVRNLTTSGVLAQL